MGLVFGFGFWFGFNSQFGFGFRFGFVFGLVPFFSSWFEPGHQPVLGHGCHNCTFNPQGAYAPCSVPSVA
jgi:hypothetical protein